MSFIWLSVIAFIITVIVIFAETVLLTIDPPNSSSDFADNSYTEEFIKHLSDEDEATYKEACSVVTKSSLMNNIVDSTEEQVATYSKD